MTASARRACGPRPQSSPRLGYVTVVAPREQSSGMGRSLPNTSDGIITEQRVQVNSQEWTVYAVGGSPAQAVLHGILEIMPEKPDLVVSGINYGENVGLGITVSGTVGAAMEAAGLGYPALAMSLQADARYHLSYSQDVDFSAAAHFTAYFARLLAGKGPLRRRGPAQGGCSRQCHHCRPHGRSPGWRARVTMSRSSRSAPRGIVPAPRGLPRGWRI